MKPATMSQEYYNRYESRLEGTATGYAVLLCRLRQQFGINFLVENMGGGNEAIRGLTEGGYEIRVTDAEDFIWSTLYEREEQEATGWPEGWMIGIYKVLNTDFETEQEPTVGVLDYDAWGNELPRLVGEALRRLAANDHDTYVTGHPRIYT